MAQTRIARPFPFFHFVLYNSLNFLYFRTSNQDKDTFKKADVFSKLLVTFINSTCKTIISEFTMKNPIKSILKNKSAVLITIRVILLSYVVLLVMGS